MKFSIRDLLLATLCVALAVAWWLDHRSRAERTAAFLRELSGTVRLVTDAPLTVRIPVAFAVVTVVSVGVAAILVFRLKWIPSFDLRGLAWLIAIASLLGGWWADRTILDAKHSIRMVGVPWAAKNIPYHSFRSPKRLTSATG